MTSDAGNRPLPGTSSRLPGGWLEVLEFVCFFRGISFCQNAGAADSPLAAEVPNVTFLQHLSEISRLQGQKAHSSIAVRQKFYINFINRVGSHLYQFTATEPALRGFAGAKLGCGLARNSPV